MTGPRLVIKRLMRKEFNHRGKGGGGRFGKGALGLSRASVN